MMLTVLENLPAGLLDLPATELGNHLAGPTLIHLPGRMAEPLFVSVLLHGNETTGWLAVREFLARNLPGGLNRRLSLLLGNVQAARAGLRMLENGPDFNRIWEGAPEHPAAEKMVQQILDEMRRRRVFASIDIHNNTGRNPHYACVNRLHPAYLQLARGFGNTVVYFLRPRGVQSRAFSTLCPAVTVECGQPGEAPGTKHAREYLEWASRQTSFGDQRPTDLDIYHTVAIVRVPESYSFAFDGEDVDLRFHPDLDHMNFVELPAGTTLAHVPTDRPLRLHVTDESGADVYERFLAIANGQLRTRVPVIPSMFTRDARIIRQDCLGYLMERYPIESEPI